MTAAPLWYRLAPLEAKRDGMGSDYSKTYSRHIAPDAWFKQNIFVACRPKHALDCPYTCTPYGAAVPEMFLRSDSYGSLHLDAPACLDEPLVTPEEHVTQLFDRLREGVYRYVMTIVRNSGVAEEITQEAFVKLYAYLREGGRVTRHQSWIYRTAHNLAVNESSRKSLTSDTIDWDWLSAVRADPSPNPEQWTLQQEKYARVRAALNELSNQQRQCILLRVEGFGYSEIAEILDVSKSTVGESLRRAMKRLKVQL
jgi:RNA polymerase sigma-70 factor, ECF subfamily